MGSTMRGVMASLAFASALSILISSASAAESSEQQETAAGDWSSVVHAAGPSVVVIRTEKALGSGFIVQANGTIVTNQHVINGAVGTRGTLPVTAQPEPRLLHTQVPPVHPALEPLKYFIGEWRFTSEVAGRGDAKAEGVLTWKWFPGMNSATGWMMGAEANGSEVRELLVFGLRLDASEHVRYTSYAVTTRGVDRDARVFSKEGQLLVSTWQVGNASEKSLKYRDSIDQSSPDSYVRTLEVSTDGKVWTTLKEFRAVRVK